MTGKLQAKIINLKKRSDRRRECLDEISALNSNLVEFDFFEAIEDNERGAIGAAVSHCSVINSFLISSKDDCFLVLEDDFSLRNPDGFDETISKILSMRTSWDVFLLGHAAAVPIDIYKEADFYRVVNAQTTIGYIINRSFAPELLATFHMSASILDKNRHLNKEFAAKSFAIDILWKYLQVKYRFITKIPSIVYQRPSYSDIEKTYVNYGC